MRGIIIAAGLGSRLGPITENMPKCMLPIAGKPLLHHSIEHMRDVGCKEIIVIVGHAKEKIQPLGAKLIENKNYHNNNILHSLFTAKEYINGPVMISYSDIYVEPKIYKKLSKSIGEIVLAIDNDWQSYYEGRTEHPLSQAENILTTKDGNVIKAGKNLIKNNDNDIICNEFLGLWKMNADGCRLFCKIFQELNSKLTFSSPYQNSIEWQNAYITDFIQDLCDRGVKIHTLSNQRGWAEFDTEQDFNRLSLTAKQQKLESIFEKNNDNSFYFQELSKKNYLKKIGARILSEANDLKRTPKIIANELGINEDKIQSVIRGEAKIDDARSLVESISENYPVTFSSLWIESDDTQKGAIIFRDFESESSSRIIDRPNRFGKSSPYYEYRDTAMSRNGPFKPEWIKELRFVDNSNPNNPDVIYNKGHLLHQVTFFIGPVNFYWISNGEKNV